MPDLWCSLITRQCNLPFIVFTWQYNQQPLKLNVALYFNTTLSFIYGGVREWSALLGKLCRNSNEQNIQTVCILGLAINSVTTLILFKERGENGGWVYQEDMLLEVVKRLNTFNAIVDLSRFNNSCLKSPASTSVDLTFQSRALRSFSLNQLRNLSL